MPSLQFLKYLLFELATIFAIWFLFYYWGRAERKRAERFLDREDLSADDFYQNFFADSGIPKETVLKFLDFVAGQLDIPVGTLRPTDRFDTDFTPEKGSEYDDGIGTLDYYLYLTARKAGVYPETIEAETLGEYIGAMARLSEDAERKEEE